MAGHSSSPGIINLNLSQESELGDDSSLINHIYHPRRGRRQFSSKTTLPGSSRLWTPPVNVLWEPRGLRDVPQRPSSFLSQDELIHNGDLTKQALKRVHRALILLRQQAMLFKLERFILP